MSSEKDDLVYKICPRVEWQAACAAGVYRGSADDRRDGFIHLSRRSQVEQTLQRHFQGHTDLLLIGFDAARLGAALRYEVSRGGELFPHLYGELRTDLALTTESLA